MSYENPQQLSTDEVLRMNIEELKGQPEFEKVPLELRAILDDPTEQRGQYLAAAKQIMEFERMREIGGLSESDMLILAASFQPYELAKFDKEKRLRLRAIKEKLSAKQGLGNAYSDFSNLN